MGKLALAEKVIQPIGTKINYRPTKDQFNITIIEREDSDEPSDEVYGEWLTRDRNMFGDVFGRIALDHGTVARRSKYDAVITIGNISISCTLQEAINLSEAISGKLQRVRIMNEL